MSFKAKIKTAYTSVYTTVGSDFPQSSFGQPSMTRRRYSETGDGRVTVKNGIVDIRSAGFPDSGVAISFSKTDPGIVTLQRGRSDLSGIPVLMVLEEGKRHICLNKTPLGNLEVITNCRALSNRITGRGSLSAEYSVEIHGFRLEKTLINVEINKIQEGNGNGS